MTTLGDQPLLRFTLNGVKNGVNLNLPIYDSVGWQLRISAHRSTLNVLPPEEYSSLKEVLLCIVLNQNNCIK